MNDFVYWSVGLVICLAIFFCLLVVFYTISRMVRHCFHVFHFWTDWEEYKVNFKWGGEVFESGNDRDSELVSVGDKFFDGIEMRKKRVCVVCGKERDELVERLYL